MIRPTTAEDAEAILSLAVSSGLFPLEDTQEVAGRSWPVAFAANWAPIIAG